MVDQLSRHGVLVSRATEVEAYVALHSDLDQLLPDIGAKARQAFGPHVESEALARAKAAGCHVVLPRSKFAGDLPRLLQLYFSQLPPVIGKTGD